MADGSGPLSASRVRLSQAERVLRDECWNLAPGAEENEPEDALRDAAFRIGMLVAADEIDPDRAFDELVTAAAQRCGMSYPDARQIVAGSFERAERAPRVRAASDAPSRRLITASTWQGREPEPRRWLWRDWIPGGTTTVFYGDGGTGKTLVAQQLGTSVVTGLPFLGQAVTSGPVFALFCEDDEGELHRRQQDINAAMGCAMADLGNLQIMPAVGEDNLLMTFGRQDVGCVTEFGERFAAMAEACEPALIIIDTAADTFGGDEIRKSQVRQFVGWCNGLALRTGAAVLLLAHPSRSGMSQGHGASGNVAWVNSARSHLYLTRPEDDGESPVSQAERVLSRLKANYAATGGKLFLAWDLGAFALTDPPVVTGPKVRLTSAQSICLSALQRALDSDGRPSPGGPIPASVRVTSADLWRRFAYDMGVSATDNEGSRRRAFFDTRKALQQKGLAGLHGELAWMA